MGQAAETDSLVAGVGEALMAEAAGARLALVVKVSVGLCSSSQTRQQLQLQPVQGLYPQALHLEALHLRLLQPLIQHTYPPPQHRLLLHRLLHSPPTKLLQLHCELRSINAQQLYLLPWPMQTANTTITWLHSHQPLPQPPT